MARSWRRGMDTMSSPPAAEDARAATATAVDADEAAPPGALRRRFGGGPAGSVGSNHAAGTSSSKTSTPAAMPSRSSALEWHQANATNSKKSPRTLAIRVLIGVGWVRW